MGTAVDNGTPSNGWIYNSNNLEGQSGTYINWLLSHGTDNPNFVFYVSNNGGVVSYYMIDDEIGFYSAGTRHVLYLSSNIKITDGTGEQSNPYKLGL